MPYPRRLPTWARSGRWPLALALLLVSAWILSRHGFEAELQHDDAVSVYSGQQMLRGVPPYRSLFDHKGPLTTIACAAAIALGEAAGIDDVLAVRLAFLAVACGVVLLAFLLAEELFACRRQAVLTCTILVGFWGYGVQAASGAFPKTLMLFLALATLLTTTRRSWGLAGASAALATLTWQPLAAFLLVALLIAWGVAREDAAEARAWLRVLGGAAAPCLALALYFAAHGALRELADGMVVFNLMFLEPTETLGRRLEFMAYALLSFRWMGWVLLVGTLGLLPLYAARRRAARAAGGRFLGDRFAALLLTLPAPFAWSLLDFQAYPDMFVFLPYAALGFAWLLRAGIDRACEEGGLTPAAGRRLHAAIVASTLCVAAFYYGAAAPRGALARQRATWQEMLGELPQDARTASVGAPQVLALLRRANTTPYGTVWRGMERFIDQRHDGGFGGWLESLGTADVLIVDSLHPSGWPRELRSQWLRFLAAHFERRGRLQRISVFVPRDRETARGFAEEH